MPSLFRLGTALLAASGLATAAQGEQQQAQEEPAEQLPPAQPPHRRQDSSLATITSVSTSVSVSVSVLTATETATSVSTTTATTTDATRVVPIFYLDERAFEGLPYTLLHRVCGSVVGVDGDGGATTFVITTTRVDLTAPTTVPPANGSSSDGANPDNSGDVSGPASPASSSSPFPAASPPSSPSSPSTHRTPTASIITASSSWTYNATGPPSTITQGPTTFIFTGTRWGDASRTVVNQCRLSGTSSARCNLTHVGPIWYTGDPNWNGTYSTYNYTWTSGDRYGFAPCTVTQGVNLLGPPAPTQASSTNGAPGGGGSGGAAWGRRGGAAATGIGGAPVSLLAILLSPEFRNVVWPLIAMIGFIAGLFTLA